MPNASRIRTVIRSNFNCLVPAWGVSSKWWHRRPAGLRTDDSRVKFIRFKRNQRLAVSGATPETDRPEAGATLLNLGARPSPGAATNEPSAA